MNILNYKKVSFYNLIFIIFIEIEDAVDFINKLKEEQ